MKHNKENIIKLLTAIKENKSALRKSHVEFADVYLAESCILEQAIWILTKKEFFEDLCSIYELEDDEK